MLKTLFSLAITAVLIVCTTCLPKSGLQQSDIDTYVAQAPLVERRHNLGKRATNEEENKNFLTDEDAVGSDGWADRIPPHNDKRRKFGFSMADVNQLGVAELDRALVKLNRFRAYLMRRRFALASGKGDYSRVRKFLNSEKVGNGFQNLGSKPLRQQRRRQGPEFNPTGW